MAKRVFMRTARRDPSFRKRGPATHKTMMEAIGFRDVSPKNFCNRKLSKIHDENSILTQNLKFTQHSDIITNSQKTGPVLNKPKA